MNKLLNIALCEMEPTPVVNQNPQVVDAQSSTGDKITYNDGQGVKDTIVMTGPLSNIYTKALNIFFSKKEMGLVNDNPDSVSVATESAAIQSIIDSGILLSQDPKENNLEVFNSINLIDASNDIKDSPKAIVYAAAGGKNATVDELEIIQAEFDRYADTDKDWVLFVGPNEANNNSTELQFDQSDVTNTNAFNAGDSFKRATEEFYAARGIPVVVGFEKLSEWLKNRSK